jgi:quercetin dioxygenase-like cupin family protein
MSIPSFPGDERIDIGDGIYMILHHNAPGNLVSTTIVPSASSLDIPYHLHPRSAETMTVLKGELNGTVAGKAVTVTLENGPLIIPPGARHGFQKKAGGGELVVCESTEPWAVKKRTFFADLFHGDKVRKFQHWCSAINLTCYVTAQLCARNGCQLSRWRWRACYWRLVSHLAW